MAEDLPADVRSVLTQLFAEARAALAAGDRETACSAVETAETVASNKLPEGPLRGRIRHGCRRTLSLVEEGESGAGGSGAGGSGAGGSGTGGPGSGPNDDCAATAYLSAMEDRVERGGDA